MDIRHLRTFVAVAERLHFRQAAERLYLSQPTVTAHVQALERELGVRLFERGGRRVRLTPEGERLLPFAQRGVALEGAALQEVRAWRGRYDERLSIVSSIFVAASVLPAALRRVLAAHPRIDISLRTAFSREVLDAIAQGEADLGLSRLPPAGSATAGRQLSREPVVAVAPAAWGAVSLAAALAEHPLLTHNHPGYWDRLLAQLEAAGLAFRPMAVGQVEVTRRLVEEGLGLSFLPGSALEGGRAALQVLERRPDLELPEAGTWALWPRMRPPSEAARDLLELLEFPAPPGGPVPG